MPRSDNQTNAFFMQMTSDLQMGFESFINEGDDSFQGFSDDLDSEDLDLDLCALSAPKLVRQHAQVWPKTNSIRELSLAVEFK